MLITPLYAAIIALLFVALSVRTLRLRHRFRVAIGSGDNRVLERAARAHANFAEYVPLALVLIFFLEIQTGNTLLVHILCAALVIGRLSHAYGVSQTKENFRFRVFGMAMTFTVILSSAGRLILAYF
ncbi:MAG: MAPEG family protein [Pseudomonadota bacterium]